jgi:two-component system, chemotaxis family, CheB/CheR fusion protein
MPPGKKAKNAAAHKKRNQHRTKLQGADYYRGGKGKDGSCPIVGIGGSAGGFEAAMELLRHLPPNTGMAFVIVQNLNPHHGSRLPRLLGKVTAMPLIELRKQSRRPGDHPNRHLDKERQLCR